MKIILGTISFVFSCFIIIDGNFDFPGDVVFMLIILVSIFNIFKHEEISFSLNKMFHVFSLFFFGVAPVVQYKHKIVFWDAAPLSYDEYFYTGFITLCSILLYNVVYLIYENKNNESLNNDVSKNSILHLGTVTIKRKLILFAFSLLFFLIVFRMKSYNVLLLLFRGISDLPDDIIWEGSQMEFLLTEYFIRPTNLILFVLYYHFYPQDKFKWWLFLIGFITMSPLSTARFATAAVYLPIMLILFKVLWKKNVFSSFIIFLLMFVWPYLNKFRHFNESVSLDFSFDASVFDQMDMDAFHNFANLLKYDVVTYGYQLLGYIFFWVPRVLWESKPTGSSVVLSDECHFSFSNVSCCYFAEGYINFGYLGIFVFTYILAVFSANLDIKFWRKIDEKSMFFVYYLLCVGFIIVIMRGELLSSVSYLIGFSISYLVACKCLGIKMKEKQ